MIKALSLAAALALLPMSAAVADEARGPSEDAIETAAAKTAAAFFVRCRDCQDLVAFFLLGFVELS